MAHAVRLSDLNAMKPSEREEALRRLAAEANAPNNRQLVAAQARIRAFEERYEMSSARLLERLAGNEIEETAEISEWLFWLDGVQPRERS